MAQISYLILAPLLAGCWSTNETRSGESHTIIEHHPTPDGGFIEKRSSYDNQETTTKSQSDNDWSGLVSKGVGQAATGDWLGLAITGGSALVAGGGAFLARSKEVAQHKQDADEAWDKLAAMHEKADA